MIKQFLLHNTNINKSDERKCFQAKKARCRRYTAETMRGAHYTDDLVLHSNTPAQVESLLPSLQQAARLSRMYETRWGHLHIRWQASEMSWLVGWVLWHVNLSRLLNAKSIFALNNQFDFKQFSLAWVPRLNVKNVSISSYSFYSNSSNSANSV